MGWSFLAGVTVMRAKMAAARMMAGKLKKAGPKGASRLSRAMAATWRRAAVMSATDAARRP